MRSLVLVLVMAAFVTPARGRTYSPHRWRSVQAIAQSADTIVIGEATHVVPEWLSVTRPDGVIPESKEAEITIRVERVVTGDKKLAGTDIVVKKEQVLFDPKDKKKRLWFIRTDDGVRRVPYVGFDGALPIDRAGKVDLWIEGVEQHERYTVDEVLARVATYRERSMRVEPRVRLLGGSELELEVVVENVGVKASDVLPPSHMFNSLHSFRLRSGIRHARDDWGSVDHWAFVGKEPMVTLAPGKRHTFRYKIPFKPLLIGEPGQYRIVFEYGHHQQSQHADASTQDSAWLGKTKPYETVLDIKKSHF
jgi:hypothetical protein